MGHSEDAIVSFEAHSIQSWITAGNKLTDLSGGSEILEALVSKERFLGQALTACGLANENIRMNAASRFEIAGDAAKCHDFCELWPLIVRTVAPDLSYSLVLDHQRDVSFGAGGDRALFGPLVDRSGRTGRPALARLVDEEVTDADTRNRRIIGKRFQASGLLFAKLSDPGGRYQLEPIRDADQLSEIDEGRRALGYVHADASGLGGFYSVLKTANNADALKEFSAAIDGVTLTAIREALAKVAPSKGKLPIRPVLAGGDDLTIVLQAHLGHAFAVAYMRAFVARSRQVHDAVAKVDAEIAKSIPIRLPIGCGVAYVHPHFPADRAIHLAESLCSWAKKQVGRTTSVLAFHRVTGSAIAGDYDDIIATELTLNTAASEPGRQLTGGPYVLERIERADDLSPSKKGLGKDALPDAAKVLKSFASVDELDALTRALGDPNLPRGPQREILALAGLRPGLASDRLARMHEISRDPKSRYRNQMDAVLEILERMNMHDNGRPSAWFSRGALEVKNQAAVASTPILASPLGDVHALLSMAARAGERAEPNLAEA